VRGLNPPRSNRARGGEQAPCARSKRSWVVPAVRPAPGDSIVADAIVSSGDRLMIKGVVPVRGGPLPKDACSGSDHRVAVLVFDGSVVAAWASAGKKIDALTG
jgi:hypothetical protein